jgi:hypothetical protein
MIQLNDKDGSWVDPLDLRRIKAYEREWSGWKFPFKKTIHKEGKLQLYYRNISYSYGFCYDSLEAAQLDARMLGERGR